MPVKMSYEDVESFVISHGNGTKIFGGTYENVFSKMIFKCHCGNEFITSFTKFKHRGKRQCNDCTSLKASLELRTPFEEVQRFVRENSRCTLLSKDYINSRIPLQFKCDCGNDFEVSFTKFRYRNQRQCAECGTQIRARKRTKTHDQFAKEVNNVSNSKYEVRSTYKKDDIHVMMEHLECGHIYNVTPSNFLNGKRCPRCSSSKGEIEIIDFLENNHFRFEREFKIPECKYKRVLPFDFAVFNKDNLMCLIEFDGDQHKVVKEFFGGKKGLEKRMMYDRIKDDFCLRNNIPLIRVPYSELGEIPHFLEKEFSKLNIEFQLSIL